LEDFKVCNDGDLLIIWKNRYISFAVRNSKTSKCRNMILDAYISEQMVKENLNLTFFFNDEKRQIYANSKLLVESDDKWVYGPNGYKAGKLYIPQDLSNWDVKQQLFIGPRNSKSKIQIELLEIKLSELYPTQNVMSYQAPTKNYIKGVLKEPNQNDRRGGDNPNGSKSLQPIFNVENHSSGSRAISDAGPKHKDSGFTIKYDSNNDKSCEFHDINCLRKKSGVCNGDKNKCGVFNTTERKCIQQNTGCGIHRESKHCNSDKLEDVLNGKYIITINATIYNTNDTIWSNFTCKKATPNGNWNKTTLFGIKKICPNTQQEILQRTITLGDLYECFTGKDKKQATFIELKDLSGILNIKVWKGKEFIYNQPCEFHLDTTILPKKEMIHGRTFISQVHSYPLKIKTKEYLRKIINNDLVIYFTTNYDFYNYNENQTLLLEDIHILYQSGPQLFVADISQCNSNIYPMTCSHKWTLTTTKNYFKSHHYLFSELVIQIKIGGIYVLLDVIIDVTYTPPEIISPPPEMILQHYETKLSPWNVKICLFNDLEMTIPFKRIKENQLVYFKADLVYDSLNYKCGNQQCIIPELALQVERIGMCIPDHPIKPPNSLTRSCKDLNSTEFVMVDLSNPNHEHYTPGWNLKFLSHNCSSTIKGSFIERIKPHIYDSFLTLSIDTIPVTSHYIHQYGGNQDGRLKSSHITRTSRRNYVSSIPIQICVSGLYYDSYLFNTCTTSFWGFFGYVWVEYKVFIFWFCVILIIAFGLWYFHKTHLKRKRKKSYNKIPNDDIEMIEIEELHQE
jgi:hypothetical protein